MINILYGFVGGLVASYIICNTFYKMTTKIYNELLKINDLRDLLELLELINKLLDEVRQHAKLTKN